MSYAKTFEPGEYLGPYRITEHLGRGAFKSVYRAVNAESAENGYPAEVALGVSHTQDAEARGLLHHEFTTTRGLDHPGIPKVYDLEETAGYFFMVMELVEGEPLNVILERSGKLSLDEAVRIVRLISEPLDHAHDCLAIHRDIKPANIVLCPDGGIKLLDFGLSRLMSHSQYKALSRVGSVSFMAPEQFKGATGFNADIWSLAVTFYLLFTGTFPFNASNEGELIKQILYDPPCLDHIEQLGLSQRLVGIMRKALAKDPEKRYRHADEFVADLEAVLRHGQAASEVEGQIETLLRAHFPLIYLNTSEEGQALASLARIRDSMAACGKELGLFVWSETKGLIDQRTNRPVAPRSGGDPLLALQHVVESRNEGIYAFLDIHRHLTPPVVRLVRDAMHAVKRDNKTLIFIAPVITLPRELESDVTLLFYDLPDEEKLRELTASLIEEQGGSADGPLAEILARAVLGLTRTEAERVLRRSAIRVGGFNRRCVAEVQGEKEQAVRKAGLLEFCQGSDGFRQVGGLEKLKSWFRKRRQAFTGEGSLYGLSMPRGVVLAGLPGCGKSLSAKALAGEWGVPLLRLDMGRIYGSLLGASEANLRKALHTAEAVSPCILWIDELEKAFGGGGNDGGTAKRVFGTFLSWLEERTSPVFVAATANNISRLPPEFTRKGRFDEIFFVGLPKEEERRAIFRVHLEQRGRASDDFNLDQLIAGSAGFSGAEIKEAVISGLYRAFEEGERALNTEDIIAAMGATVPFSRTRQGDLLALQAWAATNARAAQ